MSDLIHKNGFPARCANALLLLLLLGVPAFAQEANDADRTSNLLKTLTKDLVGVLGVAAQRPGYQGRILVNADEPFPMASTYKIPIAITLLRRIDQGELRLDQLVPVPDEAVVFSQIIASAFPHSGVTISVANLIEVMITYSDNTATDICLELAGGPEAVTKTMRSLGIQGLHVDRSTAELLKDFYGIDAGRTSLAQVAEIARTDPQRIHAPRADFEADGKDKSTPRAMLSLLLALKAGETMSQAGTDFLLGAMSRTVTKPDRLGRLLPKGTQVLHKTGTVGGVVNDVGYIRLPGGDEFAIVVFTKSSTTDPADRERAIGEVARSLYDYFAIQAD
ncbi:beta-lactamase [gamma proteobacterium NOR5-3]|nr:beta-lactamase [gamma proteobacterium NOR5-3]